MTGLAMQDLTPWMFRTMTSAMQAALRIALIVVAGYIAIRFIKLGVAR